MDARQIETQNESDQTLPLSPAPNTEWKGGLRNVST